MGLKMKLYIFKAISLIALDYSSPPLNYLFEKLPAVVSEQAIDALLP